MFRKYGFLLLVLFVSFSIFAQGDVQVNKFDDLSSQISSVKTIKELRKLISKAEGIYKTNTKQFRNDQEKLAKTTLDFALFRKNVLLTLNEKLTNSGLLMEEVPDFIKLYREKI